MVEIYRFLTLHMPITPLDSQYDIEKKFNDYFFLAAISFLSL